MGCNQQNNNRDRLYFPFQMPLSWLLKGGPGTVRGVSTTAGASGVYALRYLYGSAKLDWFSYYRSFQRTH